MAINDTITTDESITVKAEYLHWLIMLLAHSGWDFVDWDLPCITLLQFHQSNHLVCCKHSHLLVTSHTIGTDEIGALTAERLSFLPEHISHMVLTFPSAFSIFVWTSFIRLTKRQLEVGQGHFEEDSYLVDTQGMERGFCSEQDSGCTLCNSSGGMVEL